MGGMKSSRHHTIQATHRGEAPGHGFTVFPCFEGNAGTQLKPENGGRIAECRRHLRKLIQSILPQFQSCVSFRRAKSHGEP